MVQEDSQHTVQAFIDLMQRHEQSFYYFVHKVHSKGEGLFKSLMQWVEMFLTVVREGLGEPLSLEFLLPHTGKERMDILAEVDKVALYHYKLKVVYEDKLRRRFGNAQGNRDADAEDEATQALVSGVLGEIDFGELVGGDAIDIAAEETDENSDDGYSSSDYMTSEETNSDCGSSGGSGSIEDDSGTSSSSHSTYSASAARLHARPQQTHHVKAASAAMSPLARALGDTAATSSSISVSSTPPSLPHRKRSLSLKGMRSLTSLAGRKHLSDIAPPVPPLPKTPQTAVPIVSVSSSSSSSSKPLPPRPSVDRGAGKDLPPPPLRVSSSSSQESNQIRQSPPKSNKLMDKKKKKKASLIKPPELVQIPQLLPVFVELVRLPLSLSKLAVLTTLHFHRCVLLCKLDE